MVSLTPEEDPTVTTNPYDYPLNQPDDKVLLDPPLDILCSYFYFKDVNMAAIKNWGTRIIGDSGAFSAMSSGKPIDREHFHAWADRWKNHLYWIAGLDVIGDTKGTFQNWMAAKREGLDLVPTVHYGEPPETMDQYVEQGATFLGLGGMVPYKSEPKRLMRWCLSMHRYARDNHPEVRFHGWGATHSDLVDKLPWWSVDSSGFSSAFRFGTMKLFDPTRGSTRSIPLDGRTIAKHSDLLRRYYDVDWRTISTSSKHNRREVGRVAIRSQQLHAQWLQKRRKVTPPPRFKLDSNGPHLAVADTNYDFILPPEQSGPLISAALGAPSMQPLKALDPDDPLAKKPKDKQP